MRIQQSLVFTLTGVSQSQANHEVRQALADAIFKTAKFNATARAIGRIDDGLGKRYIESVDVDSEVDLVRQYQWIEKESGPSVWDDDGSAITPTIGSRRRRRLDAMPRET